MPKFVALVIYFIFGTKYSWNEGIDTCFNVECGLLGHNFDFPGGYLVFIACYLVVNAHYWVVTVGYCSLSLVTAFSMNVLYIITTSHSL